jgi:hypothetical protein
LCNFGKATTNAFYSFLRVRLQACLTCQSQLVDLPLFKTPLKEFQDIVYLSILVLKQVCANKNCIATAIHLLAVVRRVFVVCTTAALYLKRMCAQQFHQVALYLQPLPIRKRFLAWCNNMKL